MLSQSRFTPRALWELVKDRLEDSEEAFLIVDDSVQDIKATELSQTVYQVRNGLFENYLKEQLQNPFIPALEIY